MLSWVQVLTTPTADTPGVCLLLHFEGRRYLFGNVSEGTQRALTQRKVALTKLGHIFLTGKVDWQNAGGLLGMILTVADVMASQNFEAAKDQKKKKKKGDESGLQALSISGGKNLTYMLASARKFIFRKGFPLKPTEFTSDPRLTGAATSEADWQDENIRVWSIPLSPKLTPMSPRKRSHDMISNGDDAKEGRSSESLSTDENPDLLDSIVLNMFNSDWTIDALVETTLHQAKLPATLFVKDEDGKLKKYEGPLPGGPVEVPDIPVLIRKPWPAVAVPELPPTTPSSQSICYVVKGQPRRGKFNPGEAIKLGVQKRDFKLLTQGLTVKGKDGIDVKPEMVVGATIEGRGFAVVQLASPDYVDALLERPEWSNREIMSGVDAMYWNVGHALISNSKILEFMSKHSSLKHIVSGVEVSPNVIAMEGAAAKTIQYHTIDPDRFPLLSFDNKDPTMTPTEEPYQIARAGHTIQLSPTPMVQDDKTFPLMDTAALLRELPAEVMGLAEAARAKLADPAFLASIEETEKDMPSRDAEIIPLGTGSALPSKYRNVSATLVYVPGYGNYLFDCGENTLGQMRRLLGREKTDAILLDLKAIFISHLHADHHLGTASVFRTWNSVTSKAGRPDARLALVSTHGIHAFMREYCNMEPMGFERMHQVVLHSPGRDGIFPAVAFQGDDAKDFGLSKVEACRVEHCHGAVGTVVTWPSGLKIAYSGDCRPSKTFARLGRGATLLIHECTLDDDLVKDAIEKKHCTMSEALGVARDMGARRVLLTHFSQRYPKFPNLSGWQELQGDVKDHQAVLMAFDHMCVKLGDFKKAELFVPALKKLLEQDDAKPEE
ncbi:Ribonuclease Z 1 [Pleurostoma richardsiae]|uniref:ribonuclease Z n=1 Tax=Pleurostoma richardsiae TaxID=41990 RepID=A0AA38RW86_9PEZI|nr:Ribonuclease Z 1 [Pleurostoma richardsiae]